LDTLLATSGNFFLSGIALFSIPTDLVDTTVEDAHGPLQHTKNKNLLKAYRLKAGGFKPGDRK
jgi:hypothetical protein